MKRLRVWGSSSKKPSAALPEKSKPKTGGESISEPLLPYLTEHKHAHHETDPQPPHAPFLSPSPSAPSFRSSPGPCPDSSTRELSSRPAAVQPSRLPRPPLQTSAIANKIRYTRTETHTHTYTLWVVRLLCFVCLQVFRFPLCLPLHLFLQPGRIAHSFSA